MKLGRNIPAKHSTSTRRKVLRPSASLRKLMAIVNTGTTTARSAIVLSHCCSVKLYGCPAIMIFFSNLPSISCGVTLTTSLPSFSNKGLIALVNRGYIMSPYWNILGSVSPYISETECGEFLEAFEEIVKTIG
jgi:hypothetical protein